jgi:hypothetical protein
LYVIAGGRQSSVGQFDRRVAVAEDEDKDSRQALS